MWYQLRTVSMLALVLGAAALVAAPLGCSSGDNNPKPPQGAPQGDLTEPSIETPEASEAQKPAEPSEEKASEDEKPAAETAEEKEMPAEKSDEGEKPAAAKEETPEEKPAADPE